MLKSYAGETIVQIMKKNEVEFISAGSSVCWPTVFFRIHPWCQLLFQSSFRQPVQGYQWSTVCDFLLQACLVPTVLPCCLFISTRPRGGLSNLWQYHMYHLHLLLEQGLLGNQECGISGSLPWEMLFSLQGRWWVCSLPLCHMSWSVLCYFHYCIVSEELDVSCEGPICVKGSTFSCLALMAALCASRGWAGPWIPLAVSISNLSALLFSGIEPEKETV